MEPPSILDHRIFGQLLFGDDSGHTFLSDSRLISENVTGWKYNRPCDETRVQEILEDVEKSGGVDGIMYIAEIIDSKKNIKYVCYDGNHRREALSRIEYGFRVLTQVMWNAKHDEIKERFIKLNKANPVPELYMEEEKEDTASKKLLLHDLVDKIIAKWPKHQSTSKCPRKPNFNRDKLIDQLSVLHFADKTSEQVFDRLLALNTHYSKQQYNKISSTVLKKCGKTNCYLFLKDFTEDFEE